MKEQVALANQSAAQWYILYDKEFGEYLIDHPQAYKEIQNKHTVREEYQLASAEKLEQYRFMGKEHRNDGPAWIRLDQQGMPLEIRWYRHGELDRDDGPAVIKYYKGTPQIREGNLVPSV